MLAVDFATQNYFTDPRKGKNQLVQNMMNVWH